MQNNRSVCGFSWVIAAAAMSAMPAMGAVRPLLPGETTIYETVNPTNSPAGLVSTSDRTGFSQITGNAFSEEGDEVGMESSKPTYRRVTNIAVGTQTFKQADTLPYTPAFLELTIYANDGPPDLAGDGAAVEATPDGQLAPSTVIARTRIPGPTYPAGGVGRGDSFVDDFVINFPFNNVLVPEVFTVAIVNLDHEGNPDITYGVDPITRLPVAPSPGQQPSFRFGTWKDRFMEGSLFQPAPSGDLEFNNTTYNTNVWGTSRTGANINRFTNNGLWDWIEYNAKPGPTRWESDRSLNTGMEMTIYAVVPEPATGAILSLGIVGLASARRRRD